MNSWLMRVAQAGRLQMFEIEIEHLSGKEVQEK